MKKLLLIWIVFVLMGYVAKAQNNTNDEILLTINGKEITRGEFERIYKKNNDNVADQKSLEEYLDLFINFKLKVTEAESLGMDTTTKFKVELNGYTQQLAQPYLVDENVVEELIKEAYERLKTEVRASHIMVRVAPDADPADTLKAYNKILALRQLVMKGTDFATLARDSSDDMSAQQNLGDLGYFSAFRMVYPFETMAYNTAVGEVSMPIRTRFGYHIIKATDRRPAIGEIHVAHIMLMAPASASAEEIATAREKATELYAQLQAGADFAELATKYSEDPGSASKGGELPWFGSGRMIPEFETAAFALQKDGDFSQPIQTAFGWHIIKRLEKKSGQSFEEMYSEIKSKVTGDARSQLSKSTVVERLKKEYNYTVVNNLNRIYAVVDSTIFQRKWEFEKAAGLNQNLFSIDGKMFTEQDFAKYLASSAQVSAPISIAAFVDMYYAKFVEKVVIDYEIAKLPEKYDDFRYLINEYHDGILLFELTDKMVWSKAVKDSLGLAQFYETNKNNYMWEERFDVAIYKFTDGYNIAKAFKKIDKAVKQGNPYNVVMQQFNTATDSIYFLEEGKYLQGKTQLIDKLFENKAQYTSPQAVVFSDDKKLVIVNSLIPRQPKELMEAKGLITADYQQFLEEKWLQELRAKYNVVVNQEVFKKITLE